MYLNDFQHLPQYQKRQILNSYIKTSNYFQRIIEKNKMDIPTDIESRVKIIVEHCKINFVKFLQNWDYEKQFKYSKLYEVNAIEEMDIITLIQKGWITEHSDSIIEEGNTSITSPYYLKKNGKLFFKFIIDNNIQYIDPENYTNQKNVFMIAYHPDINILEVRFDSAGSGEIIPYFRLISHAEESVEWIQRNLKLELKLIDVLSKIYKYHENQYDDVIWVAQKAMYEDGSLAMIDVGKADKNKLPFIGELKQMLLDYTKLFSDSPEIRELIIDFITAKEEKCNYHYITLMFNHETLNKIKVKFDFNNETNCILHYLYSIKIIAERMDYVTRIIAKS